MGRVGLLAESSKNVILFCNTVRKASTQVLNTQARKLPQASTIGTEFREEAKTQVPSAGTPRRNGLSKVVTHVSTRGTWHSARYKSFASTRMTSPPKTEILQELRGKSRRKYEPKFADEKHM